MSLTRPSPSDAEICALLARRGHPTPVHVTNRRHDAYSSTFPAEILTCRDRDGSIVTVRVKVETHRENRAHGHRRGVSFESEVLDALVAPVGLPGLVKLGSGRLVSGEPWLLVEHLDEAREIDEAPEPPDALVAAATWVGTFHAWHDRHRTVERDTLVLRYGPEYYAGWIDRTIAFGGPWLARLPWLEDVCDRARTILADFALEPATVIHGEYTPSNVLSWAGLIVPVDWESAAAAPGEVDLAALLDKWPEELERPCVAAYAAARWPSEVSHPGLIRRLHAAKVYWDLRWLGDRPEWTRSERVGARFEHLRRSVERYEGPR
jgi:hypothetical protein